MSSDEDEQNRMRFTDQDDFTGGQWINGEYYYEEQKQGRHQSKSQQLYGIFAGDSDDESSGKGGGKGRHRGGGRGKPDYTKPLAFVSGKGSKKPNNGDLNSAAGNGSNARAGLGTSGHGSNQHSETGSHSRGGLGMPSATEPGPVEEGQRIWTPRFLIHAPRRRTHLWAR